MDGATDVEATGGKATMHGSKVTLRFAVPPAAPIVITATDKAGNKAAMSVAVPVPTRRRTASTSRPRPGPIPSSRPASSA